MRKRKRKKNKILTRNFRPSTLEAVQFPKDRKKKKKTKNKEKNKVTRNFRLSTLGTGLILLKKKEKRKQKQNCDEKFFELFHLYNQTELVNISCHFFYNYPARDKSI